MLTEPLKNATLAPGSGLLQITSITLLGDETVVWQQTSDNLMIQPPTHRPAIDWVPVFKIEAKTEIDRRMILTPGQIR